MLGLGMMAGSARATLTYCATACAGNTQSAFNTAVSGFSPLAPLEGFPTLGTPELEYTDVATGVEFLGFNKSGLTTGSTNCLTVSGTLSASNNGSGAGCNTASGEVIEIILPANIVGIELNISGAGTYCVDPAATFGALDCNNFPTVTSSSDVEFVGLVSATPLSTIWVGGFNQTSPTVAINTFEVFSNQSSVTPEGPTNLLIGSGLIALCWLHRRRRPPLPV
jgi:hypothetical protein